MNRTRRLAALTLLVAPALAVGPAVAAQAATPAAPHAPSRAACHVETESDGKYHLWGVGFHGDKKVTYSGATSGTVSTDKSGRFDIGGLSGSRFVVKTDDGKTKLTCTMMRHR
ncbi:hypothetical protein OIB37_24825 [Streptomyces sp. NBC_00820]|uniref:hypothetical protein n=1 Tax=Streptomyces sp. NBC_00820 TaxID=2975842 RepID=UPI002ED09E33|nr:hypothetical protein OIB37_24825 [Streptomyces sp. NBC_00820]